MIGIYCLIFPNSKVYIGQSNDIIRRYKDHQKEAKRKKSKSPIYNAIRKYEWKSIRKDILVSGDDFTPEQLDGFEIFWIKTFNSTNRIIGYNISPGGKRGAGLIHKGVKRTEESKKLMSSNNPKYWKGVKFSKEHKFNISQGNIKAQEYRKGIPREKEIIDKIRLSMKTRKLILQYDKQGNFIKEWDSIRQAEGELKITHGDISRAMNKTNRTVKEFMWKYKTDNYPLKVDKVHRNYYNNDARKKVNS